MKESETIRICKEHQDEFETPLIYTFAFRGAEYWCPYCGKNEGMFGAGEKVTSTAVLRNRLKRFRKLSKDFLDANCSQVCESLMWKGKWIKFDQLPQVTFIEKSGNDTKGDYTKFRFKFVADMVCWLFNNSRNGFESYSVVKID